MPSRLHQSATSIVLHDNLRHSLWCRRHSLGLSRPQLSALAGRDALPPRVLERMEVTNQPWRLPQALAVALTFEESLAALVWHAQARRLSKVSTPFDSFARLPSARAYGSLRDALRREILDRCGEADITISALAQRARSSNNTLGERIHGPRDWRFSDLEPVASALRVPLPALLHAAEQRALADLKHFPEAIRTAPEPGLSSETCCTCPTLHTALQHNIRAGCERLTITQEAFCERDHRLSPPLLNDIEVKEAALSLDSLSAVATAFGLPLSTLLQVAEERRDIAPFPALDTSPIRPLPYTYDALEVALVRAVEARAADLSAAEVRRRSGYSKAMVTQLMSRILSWHLPHLEGFAGALRVQPSELIRDAEESAARLAAQSATPHAAMDLGSRTAHC